jgi:Icc-related predicted phosphoesterase
MKILVLSDLHLEFGRLSTVKDGRGIEEGADVVVLAGDIAEGVTGIRWARETFISKEIVYVAGNHEFYDNNIDALTEYLREVAQRMGVHFLERDAVTLGGVRFLGTTLWTDFELYGADKRDEAMDLGGLGMNDFRYIKTLRGFEREADGGIRQRLFKPEDARQEHDLSVAWLDEELGKGDPARTVVVTHHAPSRLSLHPKFDGDDLSPCYISDLPGLLGRSALWIHGHVHDSFDYVVQGTRVAANPRGYVTSKKLGTPENKGFRPDFLVEV